MTASLETLVGILKDQTEAARQLLAVLEEETVVLAAAKPASIEEVAQRKLTLADTLEDLELRRRSTVGALRLPLKLTELGEALATAGVPRGAEICLLLEKVALACGERNQASALLLASRQQHVKRALELLTGQTAETELYGPSRSRRSGGGRSWARA